MVLNVNGVPVFTDSISFCSSMGSTSFNGTFFLTRPCERPAACLPALALHCVSPCAVFWLSLCSSSLSPRCHRK